MANLLKRIAPLIMAGFVAAAPLQAQEFNPLDMQNGYHAESSSVKDMIYLLTSIQTGEVIAMPHREGIDYKLKDVRQTSRYRTTPSDVWDSVYNQICKFVGNGDKFISEVEIQDYINKIYGIVWQEGDD